MASSSPVKAAATILLFVSLLSMEAPPAAAAIYKVGGSVGWTIMGSPNYTAWAATQKFQVGDTLLFEYNKNFHNVKEVSKADYGSCNAASPMATYTSGNDSIPIKSADNLYFLCGVPTHCQLGQKVSILVTKGSSAAPSSGMNNSVPASAPPKANKGLSTREGGGLALAAAAGFATFYSLIMAL